MIGKRNRLVTFERATVTTNDYGEEIQTWGSYADAFAEILFGTGQERREAAQERASQAVTVIVAWSPTLAAVEPTDRLQALGSTWDITSIAPVGLNEEIHFTAVRSV